jgi:hypothetical protein
MNSQLQTSLKNAQVNIDMEDTYCLWQMYDKQLQNRFIYRISFHSVCLVKTMAVVDYKSFVVVAVVAPH